MTIAAPRVDRVVLLASTRKDELTTTTLLRDAGIPVASFRSLSAAMRTIEGGAAAIILPEEIITAVDRAPLVEWLQRQPAWSDLPLLVLTRPGANSTVSRDAVQMLGNVTLLERPLRVATFLSAVRTAIRARQRQYEIERFLDEQVRAADALRHADQRKDEFLATLGHELRNPLAPLLSGVHLLRRLALEDGQVQRITATMERQITHLVRLVDDLLEVSRITRGLVEVHHNLLDLVIVLQEAIDSCQPVLDAARHQLSVDLPSTPIPVLGDQVRLTQVFANLLTNAAKYTDAGGRIEVIAKRHNGHAVVTVRDNGIGIPASHLSSVFDMFTQVDRSNRRAQGGLGIGLTLVRSLVELHGGRVEARSEGAGKGSEFIVELPSIARCRVEAGSSVELSKFPSRRILVVDDNRDAAETLGALLEVLGATVAVENSGPAALGRLTQFTPDAVLLDLGMPEMDGYEVARQVRAMPEHAGTLLIALTGWGQDQDVRHSRAAGFDHHLVKPPDIEKLRELLASR
jgi:signal transduction histidine kinase/CheY-like chemotaxis protein